MVGLTVRMSAGPTADVKVDRMVVVTDCAMAGLKVFVTVD